MKRIANVVVGLALVAGAYMVAPYLLLLWSRIIPPIQYGATFWLHVHGSSRWIAIASLALTWRAFQLRWSSLPSPARNSLRDAFEACLFLAVSLFVGVVAMLFLIASDQLLWFDGEYFPVYLRNTSLWINALVPINVLTGPLGFVINGNSGLSIQPAWPSSDHTTWALLVSLAVSILIWAVSLCFLRLVVRITSTRILGPGGPGHQTLRESKRALIALLFLIFYLSTPIDVYLDNPQNISDFVQNILPVMVHLVMCVAVSFTVSWLFFKLVKRIVAPSSSQLNALNEAFDGIHGRKVR